MSRCLLANKIRFQIADESDKIAPHASLNVARFMDLPPGALLDLAVAADASGENVLSVIEMDNYGRPTGRRISFSNGTAESARSLRFEKDGAPLTKFGPIGIWTEQNNSLHSRYYLFTSVHKLLDRLTDDSWHVSRLSVMLQDHDFLHIGWDDCGMIRESDGEYVTDDDFDDLTATIRIYESDRLPSEKRPELRILANHDLATDDESAQGFGGEEAGFPFEVAAGGIVVVEISNRARVPFSFAVAERGTGRVRWSCEHLQPRLANVGICAIENNTGQTQEFLLLGRHKSSAADANEPWHVSDPSILFQQDAFLTVGFEEREGKQEIERVKVDMITMGRL